MSRAIETWEGGGGAQAAPAVAPGARRHGTLWIGVLYAFTIVAILVVLAKLN